MARVAIVGATGRMGVEATATLAAADDMTLVALVARRDPGTDAAPWRKSLDDVAPTDVDVVVDLSVADVARTTLAWASEHSIDAVIGTSGLSDADLETAATSAHGRSRILVVPNFSIGAVLCQRFSAQAAAYFPSVEIVEAHHDDKHDAPSGTSIATAKGIARSRGTAGQDDLVDTTKRATLDGARGAIGAGGVRIHALRLTGLLAHQEVHFGGPGEGLVVRHDSYDYSCFMGGLLLCLRRLDRITGVEVGLECVLDQ
jgi:4-hydroxy-tetrahydrodipicolinate reductase